jgi:hypothetical protein
MQGLPYEIARCIDGFKPKQYEDNSSEGDLKEYIYLVLIAWLLYCWRCVLDKRAPEALSIINQMTRLTVMLPD